MDGRRSLSSVGAERHGVRAHVNRRQSSSHNVSRNGRKPARRLLPWHTQWRSCHGNVTVECRREAFVRFAPSTSSVVVLVAATVVVMIGVAGCPATSAEGEGEGAA